MKKKVFFLLIVLVLFAWDYANFKYPGVDLYENLALPSSVHDITTYSFSPEKVDLQFDDAKKDSFFTIPVSFKLHFWKRLSLGISELHGIRAISVYYRLKGDPGYSEEKRVTRYIYRGTDTESTYDFLLPPGEYEHLRIDFDGFKETAQVTISTVKLLDFSYIFYCEAYFYLLAVLIFAMFVIPGTLIYTLFVNKNKFDPEANLLFLFCGSLIFYLILYLALLLSLKTGIEKTTFVTSCFLLLSGVLFLLVRVKGRNHLFFRCLVEEKKSFLTAIGIIVISCFIFTGFVKTPFSFESINNNTIDEETVFSNFSGHDNKFQFINGKAIADNEPFSKYYSHQKLIYNVQDREILPGVVYSVYRIVFSTVSRYISESYLTYTLMGLCMNVMVVFPLIVLYRRYFSAKYQYIFIVILSLNTFVLPNYYFTWFKFSGAALFLAGFLILLRGRKKLMSWLAAGILLGLSSNMHAGNAMGIPVLFLWIIYLNAKEDGVFSPTVTIYPLLLTILFGVVNLPWSIVKSLYYPDNYALIRQHFFPGGNEHGLFANFLSFMKSHPFNAQVEHRMGNFFNSFRFDSIAQLYEIYQEDNINVFVRIWNRKEFFFFALSVYPLALIASLAVAFKRIVSKTRSFIEVSSETSLRHERLVLFWLSMLIVLGIILLAYDEHPDVNHMLPMGIVLIIHTLLIGISLKSGLIGRMLMFTYAGCSLWRIVIHWYFYIIP